MRIERNKIMSLAAAAAAFAGLAALSAATGAGAAPITSNTALAVSKDEWIVREQFVVARATDDPAGLGRKFTKTSAISVVGYGLTPKLALFAMAPLVSTELKTPLGTRSAFGLGDARLFARYTLFQKDGAGQTLRVAPFAGLELPTGRNDKRDSLGRLPTAAQLGSGSWDPFVGLTATLATTGWQFDASVSWQDNNSADGVEPGDVFKADASAQLRLWPLELTGESDAFLFGVLEANFVHEEKTRLHGVRDRNSGGDTLFIAPGLQYAAQNWIAEASVQLPVMQELGGTRLKKDYIARASMRFNF